MTEDENVERRIDTTILREAARRLLRGGSKGSPSVYGYCSHCGQNESYRHKEIIEVLEAIAGHAESVNHPGWYGGVYTALSAQSEPVATPAPDLVEKMAEALRYYAGDELASRPNEGPWGAASDDFGQRARETLALYTASRGERA